MNCNTKHTHPSTIESHVYDVETLKREPQHNPEIERKHMVTQQQIKQAAAAFVKESSVDALAEIIMMTPRSVRRFVKSDAFQAELDALNYDGPRDFTGRKRGRTRKYHHARDKFGDGETFVKPHERGEIEQLRNYRSRSAMLLLFGG